MLIFCTRVHALIFSRLSNSAGLRRQAISQEKTRPPPPSAGPAEINEPRWASGFGFNSASNTQTQGIYSRERSRQGSVSSLSLWLFPLFLHLLLLLLFFHGLCRTTQDTNHCLITVSSISSSRFSSSGRLAAQRQTSNLARPMEGLRSVLDHQAGKDPVGRVRKKGGNHTSADQSDELWFGQVTTPLAFLLVRG